MLWTVEPRRTEPTAKPGGSAAEFNVTTRLLVLLEMTGTALFALLEKASMVLDDTVAFAFAARVTTLPAMLWTIEPRNCDPTPNPEGSVAEASVTTLLLVLLDVTGT